MIDGIQNPKRLRSVELSLIFFVAFAQVVLQTAYALLGGQLNYGTLSTNVFYMAGIVYEINGLAVLLYVLFRQGRSLKDFGFNLRWTDLPVSVALAILAILAVWAWEWAIVGVYYLARGRMPYVQAQNVEFLRTGITAASVMFILINPFFEELIVRAYAISEITYLTGKTYLAVILSVLFQSAYHLYQGVFPALAYVPLFLIFSLYYVKRRRIMPVILAHLYFDLLALLLHSRS
jgi:membrane protease YdiL (CAAX protease family)